MEATAGSDSGRHEPRDHLRREPGRLAAFCDAVVAVAMTALVLPLLDINVSQYDTFGALWHEYGSEFTAFLASFLVIAIFWVVHHKIWFAVVHVSRALLWSNIAWLLGILVIPFASVATWEVDKTPVLGFKIYAAVMFYTAFWLGIIIYIIGNQESVHREGVVPQPMWFSLRYAAWWLLVLVACLVAPASYGSTLLEWSGPMMFVLGWWRLPSQKRAARELRERGVEVALD